MKQSKQIISARCEAMLTCGNTKYYFQKTLTDTVSLARCTETATEFCGPHALCWVHARAFQNPNRAVPLTLCAAIDGTPLPELPPRGGQ